MRRNNDVYWKDYIEQLDKAGIAPKQQVEDVLDEILVMNGEFYDKFREQLNIVKERVETKETIKEGRRKIDFYDYLTKTACMPADYSSSIYRQYPYEDVPRGDGTFVRTKKLPDRVREELKLLHWCLLELQTVEWRLMGW